MVSNAIAQTVQIAEKLFGIGTMGNGLVYIPAEHIPVGQTTVFVLPIGSLFSMVEGGVFKYRFAVGLADFIGDFPEPMVVGDVVFKFPAGAKGHGVSEPRPLHRIADNPEGAHHRIETP